MHSHELYHHRTNICIKTSLLPASTCIFNSCCACLQSMISPRNSRCFPISQIVLFCFFPLLIKPRRQRGPWAGTEGCCHTALSWDKGQACSHVCTLYPTLGKEDFSAPISETRRNSWPSGSWTREPALAAPMFRITVTVSFRKYSGVLESKASATYKGRRIYQVRMAA